jgi:hypothetical protein
MVTNLKPKEATVPSLDIDVADAPDRDDLVVVVVTCRGAKCARFRVETTDPATAQWSAGNHMQGHIRTALQREAPR